MLELLKGRRSAMTVRELAEILHLSQRAIYKLAATNQIPHFKIGSSVRFDAAAVLVWLEEKKRIPASTHPRLRRERRSSLASSF